MKNSALILLLIVFSSNYVFTQISDGSGKLDIIHIDVAQGDATLFLFPTTDNTRRKAILIDAGEIPLKLKKDREKEGGKVVLEVLRKFNIDTIDYFISTHHHSDHYGGIAWGGGLGTSFILGENQVPGAVGDDDNDGKTDWTYKKLKPDYDELGRGDDIMILNFIDRGFEPFPKKEIKPTSTYSKYIIMTKMGDRHKLETFADIKKMKLNISGVDITCLASNGLVLGNDKKVDKTNTENEHSLCFLFTYGKFNYLIGGDINGRKHASEDAEIEIEIGNYLKKENIEIDVLQVNHHGANNCSDSLFLNKISPNDAIISCGDNNTHGHPHHEALNRLAESGVETIWQTEKGKPKYPEKISDKAKQIIKVANGNIYLITDGVDYSIKLK